MCVVFIDWLLCYPGHLFRKFCQHHTMNILLLFSRSVMSDSLWSHELQHTRLPCPSLSPGVCSNSWPWIGDAIQPSHPLSPPSPHALSLSQHQGLLPVSWLFTSGSQSIGAWASTSATVLPMNIQSWFPLGLAGLISLLFKALKSLLQR